MCVNKRLLVERDKYESYFYIYAAGKYAALVITTTHFQNNFE
jgi:hypothetical protein